MVQTLLKEKKKQKTKIKAKNKARKSWQRLSTQHLEQFWPNLERIAGFKC